MKGRGTMDIEWMKEYCNYLLEGFSEIGVISGGGVTRLGYTDIENQMHKKFMQYGKEIGCHVTIDEVGNTFVSNTFEENYYLIGSHLDSVIDAGKFDGIIGVISGLMVLKWAKEAGVTAAIRVAAFRCEEASNFGYCTIGSGLITGQTKGTDIAHLKGKDGKSIEEIFQENQYNLQPELIKGIKEYLEVHIEQGRVLESHDTQIGVVSTIAGNRRYYLSLEGMAEHSGATPMDLRNDALCAAAEITLAVEKHGNVEAKHHSVATIGVLENHPNAMNVVPGFVKMGVDIRGVDVPSVNRLEDTILANIKEICARRNIGLTIEDIGSSKPVNMDDILQKQLDKAAKDANLSVRNMISGAGHDAMEFAHFCPTGMIFIPCEKGISHNKLEYTSNQDICNGTQVLCQYIKNQMMSK